MAASSLARQVDMPVPHSNQKYLPLPMCLPTWKLSIDHYYGLKIFPPEIVALGI